MTDNFSRLILALLAVWALALMPLLLLEPAATRPHGAVMVAYISTDLARP